VERVADALSYVTMNIFMELNVIISKVLPFQVIAYHGIIALLVKLKRTFVLKKFVLPCIVIDFFLITNQTH